MKHAKNVCVIKKNTFKSRERTTKSEGGEGGVSEGPSLLI